MQAHFLDWYIPRHIAGSRALNRSAKSAAAKRTEVGCSANSIIAFFLGQSQFFNDETIYCSMHDYFYTQSLIHTIMLFLQIGSPMHKPEKQAWVAQIIGKISARN